MRIDAAQNSGVPPAFSPSVLQFFFLLPSFLHLSFGFPLFTLDSSSSFLSSGIVRSFLSLPVFFSSPLSLSARRCSFYFLLATGASRTV